MKRLLIVALALTQPLWAQSRLQLTGAGGTGASGGVSNIVLIQSGTCYNTSGGASCTVTLSATGSGHLLLIVESDYTGSPGVPSLPTDGGDTFVQDCRRTGNGAVTSFSFANSVSGRTSFVMNPPAAWRSSMVVMEFSGMATSSPFDSCSPTAESNDVTTSWYGYSLGSTSNLNDLFVASTQNVVNNTDNFTVGPNWTVVPACNQSDAAHHCGNASDGDGGFVEYAVNVQGQITPTGTINNARTQYTTAFAYKSAVGGAATGVYPTVLFDMSGGTNGNTFTSTDVGNSIYGGGSSHDFFTLSDGTHYSYSNTNQQPLHSQVTVNGVVHAASVNRLSMKWNPSLATVGGGVTIPFLLSTGAVTASACGYLWWDAALNPATGNTAIGAIYGGADRDLVDINNNTTNDVLSLEGASGDSGTINVQANELYFICIQFNGANAANLSITTYDCGTAASPGFPCSTVGTVSVAGFGTPNQPTSFRLGHVGNAAQNVNFYASEWKVDNVNATSPLGP